MGKRSLLGDLTHEHGDGAAHRLIDVDNEHLLVVAKENCAPAARRQHCPHLHLDHRLVHRHKQYVCEYETQAVRWMELILSAKTWSAAKSFFRSLGLNVLHTD